MSMAKCSVTSEPSTFGKEYQQTCVGGWKGYDLTLGYTPGDVDSTYAQTGMLLFATPTMVTISLGARCIERNVERTCSYSSVARQTRKDYR